MPLCDICCDLDFSIASQIDINKFFQFRRGRYSLYSSRNTDLRHPRNVLIPYHKTLQSLYTSARSCELCRLIQGSVDEFLRKVGNTDRLSNSEFWVGGRANADGFQVLSYNGKRATRRLECDLIAAFGFCVENESRLSTVIRGRKVPPSPFDPPVLDNIKGWIKNCSEQHEDFKPQSTSLPRRILDITSYSQKAVLCNFDNTNGEYATLSYCWGSAPQKFLTSRTMESLRKGVRVRDLPQTFQDAIWITQQLGIHYLWIDNLCIVQDDPGDWERESALMSNIYGTSAITIAASRAANSWEGFLGERLERTYVPVPFNADGISGEVLAFPVPLNEASDAIQFFEMEDEPLTKRGWVLQERHLSRRTLHFCHSKICFECDHSLAMEDFCSPIQPPFAPTLGSGGFSAKISKEPCYQDWRLVVTQYSRRKLTIEDDKLPALGGLAARFSQNCIPQGGISVPHNRYLAGLWSNDMIRGMCWSIRILTSSGTRPRKYRAPTWSWASVDGEINYQTSWFNSVNELAVVQDVHVDLETSDNPFGRVVGGWVYLRALKLRPYMKPDDISFWICEDGAIFRMITYWDSKPYRAPELGKQANPAIGDTELFAIPLGWVEHHVQAMPENDKLLGPLFLIVKAVEHHVDSYVRVPGFQRVGFGIAVWLSDGVNGVDREGLKRLISENFAISKERDDLEDIILF